MEPVQLLINVAATLAIVFYFGGILYLGIPSWNAGANADALKYVSGAVTGIGGTLATFFGAVVGLNRANTTLRKANIAGGPGKVTTLTTLQLTAAWVYFGSLGVAFVLWMLDGFSTTTAEAVRNLALTLPGVIAGILAVALNVQEV